MHCLTAISYVNVVLIPVNYTDHLQPTDLSVNKAAKIFYARSLQIGMLMKFVQI